MDITTAFISAQQLALVPLVIGLVSVVKSVGLDSRWAPAASLALGVGLIFLVPAATFALTVLGGLVIGLAASGLYSTAKTTAAG
jgi:hypothetical protein